MLALTLSWMALAPVHSAQRERALTIPAGATASGDERSLPASVTLTLGVQDVLVLDNRDSVALRFGPVLVAPGQQLRLPFEQTGIYPVAASAWPGRRMTVTVVDWPTPGWERISWRLAALSDTLRNWPRLPRPV